MDSRLRWNDEGLGYRIEIEMELSATEPADPPEARIHHADRKHCPILLSANFKMFS